MEKLEHLTEDCHFEIRQKIQAELIRDFYGLDDLKKVTNEQAYAWIKSRAEIFDAVFSKIITEYPSFWSDTEQNFESGVELVKQKFVEEETKVREKGIKS
jgi:hypothetical protein